LRFGRYWRTEPFGGTCVRRDSARLRNLRQRLDDAMMSGGTEVTGILTMLGKRQG
jgi:hypothetical protein